MCVCTEIPSVPLQCVSNTIRLQLLQQTYTDRHALTIYMTHNCSEVLCKILLRIYRQLNIYCYITMTEVKKRQMLLQQRHIATAGVSSQRIKANHCLQSRVFGTVQTFVFLCCQSMMFNTLSSPAFLGPSISQCHQHHEQKIEFKKGIHYLTLLSIKHALQCATHPLKWRHRLAENISCSTT